MQTGSKILSGIKVITGVTEVPASPREISWLIAVLGTVGAALALFFIYRFSIQTISNWDGPVTVNVNELAKREQDSSLGALALAELKRLIMLKPDPIASDTAVNWEQRQREAPSAPLWHELARSLFEAAFEEASFNDHSWRGRFQSWVGEMYVFRPGASETTPLVLFVFDEEPDYLTLESRIKAFMQEGGSLAEVKIFAVFDSGSAENERSTTVADYRKSLTARVLYSVGRKNPFTPLLVKRQSLVFFSELIGEDFSIFKNHLLISGILCARFEAAVVSAAGKIPILRKRLDQNRYCIEYLENEEHFILTRGSGYQVSIMMLAMLFNVCTCSLFNVA